MSCRNADDLFGRERRVVVLRLIDVKALRDLYECIAFGRARPTDLLEITGDLGRLRLPQSDYPLPRRCTAHVVAAASALEPPAMRALTQR